MTTAAQNPDHSAHLLRANAEGEDEKHYKWESDFESVMQNSSKSLPQEDNSKLIELSKNAALIDGTAKSNNFSASDGVTEIRETLWKGGKMANAPLLKNTSHLSHFTSVGCKFFTRACHLSSRKINRNNETMKETLFKNLDCLKIKTSLCGKKMAKQNFKEKLFTLAANDTGDDKPVDSSFDSYVLLTYW